MIIDFFFKTDYVSFFVLMLQGIVQSNRTVDDSSTYQHNQKVVWNF